MSLKLKKRYPDATVFALDASEAMIHYAKHHTSFPHCICAEASALPFPNHRIDLIFANFLLPWHADLPALLKEWRRVLRPDGLLMLTALGLDTLQEWRGKLSEEDIPHLIDMHDIGDSLIQAGFADPVLDVNHYTTTYRQPEKLMTELYESGMVARSAPLDVEAVPAEEGAWAVTYEVIYAHAFAPEVVEQGRGSEGVVKISVTQLRETLADKSARKK